MFWRLLAAIGIVMLTSAFTATLEWDHAPSVATNFEVHRKTENAVWVVVGTPPTDYSGTSFDHIWVDTAIPGGSTQWQVRACDVLNDICSGFSNTVVAQVSLPAPYVDSGRLELAPPTQVLYVNGTSASTGSSVDLSIGAPGISTTSGNFIVVGISNYIGGGSAVTEVTDTAGNVYQRAGTSQGGNDSHTQDIWYSYNIIGDSTNSVTATFSVATGFRVIHVNQYSGIEKTSDPYNAESVGLITSNDLTHISAGVDVPQDRELIVAFGVDWVGGASDFLENDGAIRIEHNSGNSISLDKIVDIIGTYTLSFDTNASDQYFIITKAFKIAP